MTSERKIGTITPLSENPTPEEIKEVLKQNPWEIKVAIESTVAICTLFDELGNNMLPVLPPAPANDPIAQILMRMYEFDRQQQQLWKPGVSGGLIQGKETERSLLYQEIARDIKRGEKFYFLEEMQKRTFNEEVTPEVRKLLSMDIATLHLLLGREDKLLVGLKGGVFWKNIEWPEQQVNAMPHLRTSFFYLQMAPQIGRREMEVVPDKPLIPEVSEKMSIPNPAQTVDEALEQAYYGQKFIIPYEGAEVRFRKAGNLDKVVILQARNILFGRIVTDKGDSLTVIDLENGIALGDIKNQPFGEILAEVYRDMVTAVEVHANRRRTLQNLLPINPSDDGPVENPSVIYIPRTVRIRDGEEFRPKYKGPVRPTTPHRVSGHRRHVNMSEQHRQELQKFEQETGISILENLPIGYTFVRPHVVPSGENLEGLPVFIKKRIEGRLIQDIQRPDVTQSSGEGVDGHIEVETEMIEGEEVEVQKGRFPFRFPKLRRN